MKTLIEDGELAACQEDYWSPIEGCPDEEKCPCWILNPFMYLLMTMENIHEALLNFKFNNNDINELKQTFIYMATTEDFFSEKAKELARQDHKDKFIKYLEWLLIYIIRYFILLAKKQNAGLSAVATTTTTTILGILAKSLRLRYIFGKREYFAEYDTTLLTSLDVVDGEAMLCFFLREMRHLFFPKSLFNVISLEQKDDQAYKKDEDYIFLEGDNLPRQSIPGYTLIAILTTEMINATVFYDVRNQFYIDTTGRKKPIDLTQNFYRMQNQKIQIFRKNGSQNIEITKNKKDPPTLSFPRRVVSPPMQKYLAFLQRQFVGKFYCTKLSFWPEDYQSQYLYPRLDRDGFFQGQIVAIPTIYEIHFQLKFVHRPSFQKDDEEYDEEFEDLRNSELHKYVNQSTSHEPLLWRVVDKSTDSSTTIACSLHFFNQHCMPACRSEFGCARASSLAVSAEQADDDDDDDDDDEEEGLVGDDGLVGDKTSTFGRHYGKKRKSKSSKKTRRAKKPRELAEVQQQQEQQQQQQQQLVLRFFEHDRLSEVRARSGAAELAWRPKVDVSPLASPASWVFFFLFFLFFLFLFFYFLKKRLNKKEPFISMLVVNARTIYMVVLLSTVVLPAQYFAVGNVYVPMSFLKLEIAAPIIGTEMTNIFSPAGIVLSFTRNLCSNISLLMSPKMDKVINSIKMVNGNLSTSHGRKTRN